MQANRPLTAFVTALLLATAVAVAHAGPAAEPRQPKTHLGGKPDAMVALVEDCSGLPAVTCGDPRCAVCFGGCAPGTVGYPLCCGDPLFNCGATGNTCTISSQCGTITCPSGAGSFPSACVSRCLGGDREGYTCQTTADCPHLFPKPGEACQARSTAAQPGEAYTVPLGTALVVTDVLFDGTVTVASDDQKTKVTVAGTQHFTAGIVLPAGSHVNITRSATAAGPQLLGYLVRAQ